MARAPSGGRLRFVGGAGLNPPTSMHDSRHSTTLQAPKVLHLSRHMLLPKLILVLEHKQFVQQIGGKICSTCYPSGKFDI